MNRPFAPAWRTWCAALLGLLLVAGCGSIDPRVYADQKPALDLQRYFDGRLIGHGMVTDRAGQVTRRFVVTIDASWQGDTGTLDERFVWSDGAQERRVWTLKKAGTEGGLTRWIGTADDVVGSAQGVVSGNALNWSYTLRVKTDGGQTWNIAFDDWMFLIDDRVMLNKAVMSFYGLPVGEVIISFTRP